MAREVRPATAGDVDAIMLLAYWMTTESPRYRDHGFSSVKARALIERLIELGGLFVAVDDNATVGFIAGVVNEHFLSTIKVACDIGVYVLPPYRGNSLFARLVRTYEQWAIEQGAQEISVGVSTGVHPEKTVCMYERMGYRMATYGLLKSGAKECALAQK